MTVQKNVPRFCTLSPQKPVSATGARPNVALLLGQRRTRCASIKTTLGQRLVFAGRTRYIGPVLRWLNIKSTWVQYIVFAAGV